MAESHNNTSAANTDPLHPKEQRNKRGRGDSDSGHERQDRRYPKIDIFRSVARLFNNLTDTIDKGRHTVTDSDEVITGDINMEETDTQGTIEGIQEMAVCSLEQATHNRNLDKTVKEAMEDNNQTIAGQFQHISELYNKLVKDNIPAMSIQLEIAKQTIKSTTTLCAQMAMQMQEQQEKTFENEKAIASIRKQLETNEQQKQTWEEEQKKLKLHIDEKIAEINAKTNDYEGLVKQVQENTTKLSNPAAVGGEKVAEMDKQLEDIKQDIHRKNDEHARSSVHIARIKNAQNKSRNQLLEDFYKVADLPTFFQNKILEVRLFGSTNEQDTSMRLRTPNPWTAQIVAKMAAKKLSDAYRNNQPLPASMQNVSVYQGTPHHTQTQTRQLVAFAKDLKAKKEISHFITKYDVAKRASYITVFRSFSLADRAHFGVSNDNKVIPITEYIEGSENNIDGAFYIASEEENRARGNLLTRDPPRTTRPEETLNTQNAPTQTWGQTTHHTNTRGHSARGALNGQRENNTNNGRPPPPSTNRGGRHRGRGRNSLNINRDQQESRVGGTTTRSNGQQNSQVRGSTLHRGSQQPSVPTETRMQDQNPRAFQFNYGSSDM